MPYVHVVSAEPQAESAVLRRVGDLLVTLADGRRSTQALAHGSPSPALREAVAHFVEGWERTLWMAGQDARQLSLHLGYAVEHYSRHEAGQAAAFHADGGAA